MRTFIVDTHALAWFVSRDPRLSDKARTILRDPNVRLIIPAIVLAEIKYLAHKGRLTQTLDEVLRVIGSDPRCTIYPIDLSVVSKAPFGLNHPRRFDRGHGAGTARGRNGHIDTRRGHRLLRPRPYSLVTSYNFNSSSA
jgi:PIN domain nuclease of toxin-antitoxin system